MKHDTPSPFHPPRECGTRRAIVFAVLTHALLFALLFYGISWQSNPPAGVEAELWSSMPETTPDAAPPPEVADKAESALPSPSSSQSEQAEIALQQAKRKLEKQQQQLAQLQQQQEAQKIKERQQQATQEKKAREAERKQQLAEQQKMLRAQQQAQELAKQQRQARLSALQGIAGHSSSTDGLTSAGKDAGSGDHSSPGYVDKVRRHVKSNMAFNADATDGNPQAVVAVQCAPDGSILNAQIVHASGNPAWDDAVLRAVQKSDPMPRDSNGKAPSNFTFTYRLND